MRTIARTRSSSVESGMASTPARANALAISASRARPRRREPAPEGTIGGIDDELLAGLGILDEQRPDVGQSASRGSREPDREDLVAAAEELELALPARLADEVGDDEDERPTPHPAAAGAKQRGQVGHRRAGMARMLRRSRDEPQDLVAAGTRRDDPFDLTAIEDRADPVAVARQDARQRGDDIDEHGPLVADRRRPTRSRPRG